MNGTINKNSGKQVAFNTSDIYSSLDKEWGGGKGCTLYFKGPNQNLSDLSIQKEK